MDWFFFIAPKTPHQGGLPISESEDIGGIGGDSLWCQWKKPRSTSVQKSEMWHPKKGAKSEKISSEEPCLIWICCKMMVGSHLDQHLAEKVVREANSSSFTVSYSWKLNLATTGCHDGKRQQTECENFKLWSLELCQSPRVVAWKSQSKLQRLGGTCHIFLFSAATTFRDNVERKCGVSTVIEDGPDRGFFLLRRKLLCCFSKPFFEGKFEYWQVIKETQARWF